jgi:hypothetical protein
MAAAGMTAILIIGGIHVLWRRFATTASLSARLASS